MPCLLLLPHRIHPRSFRTEPADFFFPFASCEGSARAERNLLCSGRVPHVSSLHVGLRSGRYVAAGLQTSPSWSCRWEFIHGVYYGKS
jgi:hypothetical protein